MSLLPDTLSRFVEPVWSSVLPSCSVLVVERDDGSIEIYSSGKSMPWKDGANIAAIMDTVSDANKLRRLRAAIEQIESHPK